MNSFTLSAKNLTYDSSSISITQVDRRNVYFKVADALVSRISALEEGTIDLSNYSASSVSITATSGNIALVTSSGTLTYNGVEVATINDLPTTATSSVSGLVKVTSGNGLTLTSGTIAMAKATTTVAGAVMPEVWSSSNLNGLVYSSSTGALSLPTTVATSHTSSGGLVSYSVTNNVGTITLTGATSAQVIAGTSSAVVVTPSALAGAKNVAGGYAGVGADGYIPDSLIKAAVIQQTFFPSVGSYGGASLAVLMAIECKGLITSTTATSYTALDGTTGTIAEGDLVALYSSGNITYYTKTDGSLVATTDIRLVTNGDYIVVADSTATDGVSRYLVKDAPTTSSGGSTYAPYLAINDDTCMKLIENKDIATTVKVGLVSIGDNITVTATGSISVALASSSGFGVVKAGTNVTISSGVLSVATATSSVLGLVKVGTNINVSSGTISVATATSSVLGLVKVGTNITVSDGTISVATATSSVLGLVKVGTNISVSSGTISVATATDSTKGVLSVDTSDRLKIESGVLSYANTALVAVSGTTASATTPVTVSTSASCLYSYYYPLRVKVTYVSGTTTVVEFGTVVPIIGTSCYEVYLDDVLPSNYTIGTTASTSVAVVEVYVER